MVKMRVPDTIIGDISSWKQSKHFCNCTILKCGDRDRNFAEIQLSLSSNANGKVEGEVAINFRGQRTPDLSIFEDLRKGEAGYVLFGTCGHRSVFLEMAGNGEEERKTAGKFFQNENKR